MKPESRVRKPPREIQPHADQRKHVMKYQEKYKSELKLGKSKTKLAERKKALRAEASKTDTASVKEEKRKKETERKRIQRMKSKQSKAPAGLLDTNKPDETMKKKK